MRQELNEQRVTYSRGRAWSCAKYKRANIDTFEEFDNETCRVVRPDAEDGPASQAYLGDRSVSISRKTSARRADSGPWMDGGATGIYSPIYIAYARRRWTRMIYLCIGRRQ